MKVEYGVKIILIKKAAIGKGYGLSMKNPCSVMSIGDLSNEEKISAGLNIIPA